MRWPPRMKSRGWSRAIVALATAVVGTLVTLTLFDMLVSREREVLEAGLEQRGNELTAAIEERVEANFDSIGALASFFIASEEVTWQEFQTFTRYQLAQRRGVQSLQWVPRVRHEDRAAHETTPLSESRYMRDGDEPPPPIEDYAIRELTADGAQPAEQRQEYFPIYYLAPWEAPLWGIDLATIPTARRAMEEAMATGQPTATAPIRDQLVWVFRYVDREVESAEEDRSASGNLDGFVAAAFRGDRVLEDVLAWFWPADVYIEVWDESVATPRLLFEREAEERATGWRGAELEYVNYVEVGQLRWRVVSRPGADYLETRQSPGPLAVLAGGAAVTVLLAAYLTALITRMQQMREEAADRAVRARQQTVVADLSLAALSERSLEQMMQRGCEVLADALNAPYASVFTLTPEGKRLQLSAGVGWPRDAVGSATVDADGHSQFGYTLEAHEPVAVEDLAREERFEPSALILEHGVVSGVSAIIHAEQGPYGLLGVHDTRRRRFTPNDIAFLQAVANVLGQAVVQRRIENELRESEQRFRTMADAAPVLIWVTGPERNVTYINRQWLVFTGRTLEQELGFGWMQGLHPDDVERFERTCAIAVEHREPFRIEYRLRRADGEYRWLLVEGRPRSAPRGRFLGYIGSCVDITDQKRAEQQLKDLNETLEQRVSERTAELRRANEALESEIAERRRAEAELQQSAAALERSNRELEQFAYIASHDLQEPLRKIEGFGDMIVTGAGDGLDEESRDYLKRMMSASKRMRDLINGLLAYSRVTTRVQPFETVDLNALVEEVMEDLEFRIRDTNAEVDVKPLPVVRGDPLQLRQLFQNLISNALKFHKPDEPPRVALYSDGEADEAGGIRRCRVHVRDEGIGIEQKYLDRLFVPFQRPIHARGQYEGTGIGLAICRKIAETHGGRVEVESTPGQGSTFHVTLPCISEGGEKNHDAAGAPGETHHHRDGRG